MSIPRFIKRQIILPSYPPAAAERVAQVLQHDPHSTIALFMETALMVVESNNDKEQPEQDLCVVCNSDYVEISVADRSSSRKSPPFPSTT